MICSRGSFTDKIFLNRGVSRADCLVPLAGELGAILKINCKDLKEVF